MKKADPNDSPYVAWIDLETTGNREDDSIIEVGFVLTDRDLNEVRSLSLVIVPHDWHFQRDRMTPVVVGMHEKNGLLSDIELSVMHTPELRGPSGADHILSGILKSYGKGNHIPLAGSGVSHFDRKYIRREMPKTDGLLSYWALDIGVMRRWLERWDIYPEAAKLQHSKTHRALDDIREHIAEAKTIRDHLQLNAEEAWRYNDLNR